MLLFVGWRSREKGYYQASVSKCAENPECTHPALKKVNGTATLENYWIGQIFTWWNLEFPHNPAILFLGTVSRKTKPYRRTKTCMSMFRIVTLTYIIHQSPKVEQPKCSSVKELNNSVISAERDMIHLPNRIWVDDTAWRCCGDAMHMERSWLQNTTNYEILLIWEPGIDTL